MKRWKRNFRSAVECRDAYLGSCKGKEEISGVLGTPIIPPGDTQKQDNVYLFAPAIHIL